MAGLVFGVYGHTKTDGGVLLHHAPTGQPLFAIIDALTEREYLEVLYDAAAEVPLRGVSVVPF